MVQNSVARFKAHSVYAILSCILGPFWSNDEYLVVTDYSQQNVYQLKPASGEVRAIPMRPCRPWSLTFDPSINGFYVTCVETISNSGGRYQFRIRKKTFDGKINNVIYNAPQGKEHCHSILVFISLMASIFIRHNDRS